MPKEYEDIKNNVKKEYPNYSEEQVSSTASAIFYKVFGITVKEAITMENEGGWKKWLKTHSKKSEEKEFNFTYSSGFEFKEVGEDLHIQGFLSGEELDENGDVTSQDVLFNKVGDVNNPYSYYLSYKHKWLKGDKIDKENALGVLKSKDIRINPKTNKKGVWGDYLLLKTSPYYNDAIYDIKNGGVSGFSIEFKEAERKPVKIGNVNAYYLNDFFYGGAGLVARPAVHSACMTGFFAKEFEYNDDLDEEKESEIRKSPPKDKEIGVGKMESKEEGNIEVNKSESETLNQTKTEDNNDINKFKSENDLLKKQIEVEKLNQEKERLTKELQELKAKNRVLVPDKSEQNIDTVQNDIKNIRNEKSFDFVNDKNVNVSEKIRQLTELQFEK